MQLKNKNISQSFILIHFLDAIILAGSILLFFPGIVWLGKVFLGLYDLFNLVLLLIITTLIILKIKNKTFVRFKYQFKIAPSITLLFAYIIWLISFFVLEINILSASAGLLFAFGILGLYIETKFWLKSIVPFLLILMTLPFGNIMDVYLGFPLRMMTVDFIANVFNSLGIENITSSSIITIENSATQIDFSCSGLKGIWAALIFYFSISWLDQLKINGAWFFVLLLLIALNIGANIFRIFIIILLTSVYDFKLFADIIHAPLGIIGFVFSCGMIYLIIKTKYFKRYNRSISNRLFSTFTLKEHLKYSNLKWTKLIIITILLIGICIPKKNKTETLKEINPQFSTAWEISPLALSEIELAYFKEQGSSALKFNFRYKDIEGTLLLVHSNGWRGHHNPEYCIRAGGHRINKIETLQVNKMPVKWMNVNQASNACYWFQSPSYCTDDFGTRVWSEVKHEETNWVLVSIVFNSKINAEDIIRNNFLTDINKCIHTFFETSL